MTHWPEHRGLRRVGLTGGIAAGKSVVAARLRELGVAVVDHDVLAREVVGPGTPGLAALAEAFPGSVHDGRLDRGALGAVVFADPAARTRLNELVHPLVHDAAVAAELAHVVDGARTVVHDVPLLVETGQGGHFSLVVVVDAPEELRVRRLVEGRGLTEDEAWQRMAAQADDDTRLAVAGVVLDGSGSAATLRTQVDVLVGAWRADDAR
jgi:dephospho-CoA kinase